MADSTIANLPSGSPAQTTDQLPVQRSGATLKLLISDILAYVDSSPIDGTTAAGGRFLPHDTALPFGTAQAILVSNMAVNDTITGVSVTLAAGIKITTGTVGVNTLSASGTTSMALFGLYTSDGNTLLAELIISLAATGIKSAAWSSAITLPRGQYILAWGTDAENTPGTGKVLGTPGNSLTTNDILKLLNANNPIFFSATNTIVAGPHMPATLGARSAFTPGSSSVGIPYVYVEP